MHQDLNRKYLWQRKKTSLFECQHCGEQSTKWLGKCPNCGGWDSFIELNQEQQEVLKKKSLKFHQVLQKQHQ